MYIPITALIGVIGAVINMPIVAKALTNMAAGTSNRIDDAVVLALVAAAKSGENTDRVAQAVEAMIKLQEEYDSIKQTDADALASLKSSKSDLGLLDA